MNENNINRRQIIKMSSVAALSTMVPPSPESAKEDTFNKNNIEIPNPESKICFMKALDLAALLRNKKISAREVMEAHLTQIKRVNSKVNATISSESV